MRIIYLNSEKQKKGLKKTCNSNKDSENFENSEIIQKQIEDVQRDSEERYRALFDATFEAIFISVKGI